MRKKWKYISLLFLIPLSCIVVPNRKLANTLLFSSITNIALSLIIHNNMNIDINMDTLKDRSIYSSTDNSRELLVYSSLSSISYIEKIEVQSNNSS